MAAMTLSTESIYEHCGNCCQWTKRFLNVKIWRNRGYVIWVVSLGVALFGYFVPFFHLPKYTQDTFPGEDGSWLILCLSITSGVSRIICGKVADLPWVSRIRMQQFAFVILGVSTICIPFASSFPLLIVINLIMGICDGIFVCLLGPIAFDIVGPAEASQAIGFLLGIFSIPFTAGPPIAGWMYDVMGNYRIAFHVAGAPPILGAIIMFFIPKIQQSFPAVTETMEFASISMMDVYNDIKVPKDKQLPQRNRPAGPSGPSTEVEYIRSTELLYLGTSPPQYIQQDAEGTSPSPEDEDTRTHSPGASVDADTDKEKLIEGENVAENVDKVGVQEEAAEVPAVESSSLMNEIGKYLEVNSGQNGVPT